MYYKLDERYAFRGWKRLPFAIRCLWGPDYVDLPRFYKKPEFMMLLSCNGQENLDTEKLPADQKDLLDMLVQEGVLHTSSEPMGPLNENQRYKVFPSIYIRSVQWSITGKCNMRCRHCMVSAPSGCHPQLPLEALFKIIDQMAAMDVRQVDLTGGEPLVRPDFFKLVEKLSLSGIRIGTIFTNGALVTPELLDKLKALYQHPNFQLSYDGKGYHDWLRNVPGAEDSLIQAIDLLHSRGYQYSCAMCLHWKNKDSLLETVMTLAEKGCDALKVNNTQGVGNWKEYEEKYAMSDAEVWEIYKQFIQDYFKAGAPIDIELDGTFQCDRHTGNYAIPYDKRYEPERAPFKGIPYCQSIKHRLYIDAEGRLVPCMGFAENEKLCAKFPSLLTDDLAKATWDSFYSEVANTSVQDFLDKNPKCVACPSVNHCGGGCMVSGMTDEGDYLVPDPSCCWFHLNIGPDAVRAVADEAIATHFPKNNKGQEGS